MCVHRCAVQRATAYLAKRLTHNAVHDLSRVLELKPDFVQVCMFCACSLVAAYNFGASADTVRMTDIQLFHLQIYLLLMTRDVKCPIVVRWSKQQGANYSSCRLCSPFIHDGQSGDLHCWC